METRRERLTCAWLGVVAACGRPAAVSNTPSVATPAVDTSSAASDRTAPLDDAADVPRSPDDVAVVPSTDASTPAPPATDAELPLPSELVGLPSDPRHSRATFDARWRRYCDGFARADPCEFPLDVDGDGRDERVLRIRERSGTRDGLAIVWSDGRVSVLGAGESVRVVWTEVFLDGSEAAWQALDESFTGFTRCRRVRRRGPGFADVHRRGKGGVPFPALSPTGDGIWLVGGDAAAILHWDGARWRLLALGF